MLAARGPDADAKPAAEQPVLSKQVRTDTRIAAEQIKALFEVVTLGVCGAAGAATILAAVLYHLGALSAAKGIAWASYVIACAAGHILLRRAYARSGPVIARWPFWARWFTLISLAEGIGWGWAPVGLVDGNQDDVRTLVVLIMAGVAAGASSAFSSYLPAFLALFIPATLPTFAQDVLSGDPVQHGSTLLVLLFILVMGSLGVKANHTFIQLVGLRLKTEELAADLKRQKEIAERANRAKSTFLAAASHDLRQPVHALGLFVGALRGVPMPSEGRRLLEQIEASTNAMDGLFSALLDISRLDAGTIEVHRRPFSIAPLLGRICRDHVEDATAKGLALVCRHCSATVDCDPVLLERVVRNLVSNAVRYTNSGRVVVGCRRRGRGIAVQIWDTGLGIPPDQRDKIFQEYYQLANPERDRIKGLGLGLAIVRRLTDLLGCRLTLRSQLGRGSCFEVEVPLAAGVAVTIEAATSSTSGPLQRGLVVIVDDERAICDAMSALLSGWGYDVIAAGSGREATQKLAMCPIRPCLLICDYRLRDGENGIDVIEQLRSDYNEALPAMLITGDTAPDRLAEARASGLLLLHKPVPNGRLRAAIANLTAPIEADTRVEAEPVGIR